MQKLIEGLRYFQEHVLQERRAQFERSVEGQDPQALLITCSDSRVLPETLLQAQPGDLFISRNAGNLVPPPEFASGEAATVAYAVGRLKVTDVVICGHYRCAAVKELLEKKTDEESPVNLWLAHTKETLTVITRDYPHLDGEARWDKAVEQNVLVQMANLTKHPVVAAGLASGTLRLHAWVLRFESCEILAYDATSQSFKPLLDAPLSAENAASTRRLCRAQPIEEASDLPAIQRELSRDWLSAVSTDLPASLVVFAAALPLCIAIARASGVPTAAGIVTAIVGGIIVGLLGGGALQVSGPTAGLVVILLGVSDRLGAAGLSVVVVLAGLFQVLAACLRLGDWFRMFSPAVILGMLAGIGSILFAQQIHVTVDDAPDRSPILNVARIPEAFWNILKGHDGHPEHFAAAMLGLLTLAGLLLWRPLAPNRLKVIPAPLFALAATTVVAALFALPVQRVEFNSLTALSVLDFSMLPAMLQEGAIWRMAIAIAVVASAESLLTAAAVDQMHTGPRTRYNRELAAQGIGNGLCGLIGALPMASVIVRSSANVQAGAQTRLSAVLHGFWLLAFALLLPSLLRLIPTAALAATLVLTGMKLIDLRANVALWKEGWTEGIICLLTAITVVLGDLLVGVLLGILLSALKLIVTMSRLRVTHRHDMYSGQTLLALEGSATFLQLPALANALETVPRGTVVHVDCKALNFIDHACFSLLMNWAQRHKAAAGLVVNAHEITTIFERTKACPPRQSSRHVALDEVISAHSSGERTKAA